MDNSKLLILVGKEPGATHMTILDDNGEIIMQRYILVSSPNKKYVRIRRNCTSEDCEDLSVYYCPGICHQVIVNTREEQMKEAELRRSNADASYDEARANQANANADAKMEETAQ
jgi:hypothetical protein